MTIWDYATAFIISVLFLGLMAVLMYLGFAWSLRGSDAGDTGPDLRECPVCHGLMLVVAQVGFITCPHCGALFPAAPNSRR